MSTRLSSRHVRPAWDEELRRTARLHRRLLPDGFFARLGARFLRRYHQAFAQSPAAEVLVVPDDDGAAGMLVGTFDNAAHYRWVMRHRAGLLVVAGLVALLSRPRLAVEFVRTRVGRYARAVVRYLGRRRRSAPAAAAPERVAVLTHVAVAPRAQGDGAGRALVQAFVSRARRHGADEVRLITPADGPGAGFYRSLGWRRLRARRAADGTVVEEFVLPL